MRRVISVLLENEAGALSRVIGLFAQRNYNIDTLSVAPTEDATLICFDVFSPSRSLYRFPWSVLKSEQTVRI